MSNESKIMLIHLESHEVIYEYALNQSDEAYSMAKELEKAGVAFELRIPSVTETLADSLGASDQEKENLRQSEASEIEGHN